jgi:hypothetical protein
MPTHKLDLLPNVLDSCAEAFAKFETGEGGNPKVCKFARISFCSMSRVLFVQMKGLGFLLALCRFVWNATVSFSQRRCKRMNWQVLEPTA